MRDIELSESIRLSHPASKRSVSMRRLVYGVGVNDADYSVSPNVDGRQIRCPAYASWAGILKRSYSDKVKKSQPTYTGTTVSGEWLYFSKFRSWWLDNYVDGWALDKDLISTGNKVYCPELCVYIPQRINNFLSDSQAKRGNYKIGVTFSKCKGRFEARCWCPFSGGQVFLGRFTSEHDAHFAWLKFKISVAERMKSELDSIDTRLFTSIMQRLAGFHESNNI